MILDLSESFTEHIETFIHTGDDLMKNSIEIILKCLASLVESHPCDLPLLNCSRLPETIPKHSMTTGFCTLAMIIGRCRCIFIGNKCNSN